MQRRQDKPFPENGFESWGGYMQAKIAKLEEQFSHDVQKEVTKESNIFDGVSIFVNGYTKPSSDELKLLVSQHGGTFHSYQRTGIDFIIASNLPDTKVKRLTSSKIVKPEWITESIAAGQLLDYKNYLLYSKSTRTQPRLNFYQGQGTAFKSVIIDKMKHEVNHIETDIHLELNDITTANQNNNKVSYVEEDKLGIQKISEAKRLLHLGHEVFKDDIILAPNISMSSSKHTTDLKDDKPNKKSSFWSEDKFYQTNGNGISQCAYENMFHETTKSAPIETESLSNHSQSKKNQIVSNVNKDNSDVSQHTKSFSHYFDDDMFVDDITVINKGSKGDDKQSSLYVTYVTDSHELSTQNDLPNSMQDNLGYTSTVVPSSESQHCQTITNVTKVEQENMTSHKDSTRIAGNAKFLTEFYNNSRLHHISQLGAAFKQYINNLRQSSNFQFPKRALLPKAEPQFPEPNSTQKIIMHIDMDCFFVSVGLRKHPHLKGFPVAVTHAKDGSSDPQQRCGVQRQTEFGLLKKKSMEKLLKNANLDLCKKIAQQEVDIPSRVDGVCEDGSGEFSSMSEIASCSYEARLAGIKNGMFMGAARRLCPTLKTIPYDFDGYKEVAYVLYDTIAQYTLDIEAVSCDEMYADCTELLSVTGLSVDRLATTLRREIQNKTGCSCSAGFGSNRLQARIATKKAKPNGQFHLTRENVLEHFSNIPIGDLPGVGRQMQRKLSAMNIATCGDLRNTSLSTLQKYFGVKTGQQLYQNCRGEDSRPLSFVTQRKSVSAEVNYGIRFEDKAQCEVFLKQLCKEVHSRLQQLEVVGRAVTLKLMVRAKEAPIEPAKFMGHGFCDNLTKTSTFNKPTNDLNVIIKEVTQICNKLNVDPKEMRGIGIQMTKLESSKQNSTKSVIWNQFQRIETSKNVESKIETAIDVDDNLVAQLSNNSNYLEVNSKNVSNKESKLCEQNIKSKNETIKINMFENIVNAQRTPTKFTSLHGVTLQKTPIKNSIMLDFLKGEKSIEKSKNHNATLKSNLQSPMTKFNLQNSSAVTSSPIRMTTPPKKKTLGVMRKRGRPPKHASSLEQKNSVSRGIDKFLTTKTFVDEEENFDLSGLDASVLASLPEDIRQEVLKQHQREKKNKTGKFKMEVNVAHNIHTNNQKLQIDRAFLAELPESLRTEILTEYEIEQPISKNYNKNTPTELILNTKKNTKPQTSTSKDSNAYSKDKQDVESDILLLPWKQIKEMLRKWLGSEALPLRCDAQLMSSYMQNMVWNKDIEKLIILVNFLNRKVNEIGVPAWHAAYVQIMDGVQRSMLDVYGKRLMVLR